MLVMRSCGKQLKFNKLNDQTLFFLNWEAVFIIVQYFYYSHQDYLNKALSNRIWDSMHSYFLVYAVCKWCHIYFCEYWWLNKKKHIISFNLAINIVKVPDLFQKMLDFVKDIKKKKKCTSISIFKEF